MQAYHCRWVDLERLCESVASQPMLAYRSILPMPGSTILTIGNFDGVHLGHAALLRRARRLAAGRPAESTSPMDSPATMPLPVPSGGHVVAMVFDPHPMTFLKPDLAPATLTTFDRRSQLLLEAGADEVVRLRPTPDILDLTPEAFLERLIAERKPAAIVEGGDFRFGRARSGDISTLRALGKQMGFHADIVLPVEVALTDQSIVTASSTLIRWLIAHGRMIDAALMLGRPYEISGIVSRGDRRGREIGFPTANLTCSQALPADGIYAARARLADGRRLNAALHIGPRATFADAGRTVEAHILDWAGPIAEGADEYGWPLTLEIVAWLRGQARFDSVQELTDQIERDVARARQSLDRRSQGAHVPARHSEISI